MENQKQKALIFKEFKKPPVYGDYDIPQPGAGIVQIKVIASTINPSDRMISEGGNLKTQTNFVGGLQGFGEVIKSGSPEGQNLIGKKVSFSTFHGTWAQYTIANIQNCWVVDDDVPIESKASGFINPITVIGFIDTFKKWRNRGSVGKGIINTAAASALGRMLNKFCQKENIPLLNIVRRPQQVKILQDEGAKYIIDTSKQNWLDQYKVAISNQGFNILFDAIGGGEITDKLICNLPPLGVGFVYGKLSPDNFILSRPLIFSGGVQMTTFSVFEWLPTITKEQKDQIQKNLSKWLKNQLSTKSIKTIKLSEVPKYFKESEKKATQGKYTILI